MKHFLLSLFTLIVLCGTSLHAQDSGWRLGFGISGGPATTKPFNFALGGDIRLQKNFNDRVAGTFTAGFTHFFEKDHFIDYNQYGSPYNVIPVKAGVKVFLANNFYVSGEAGVGIGFEQWGQSFLWSPSVGVAFKNGLDISIRYEDFTASGATKDLGLRLAYGLSTRKLAAHKNTDTDKGWQLGVGVNPGVDINFGSFVLGGDATVYKSITINLEAYGSAGITHLFNQYRYEYNLTGSNINYSLVRKGINVVPVKLGLRLYPGDQFYISGDAGAAFSSNGNTAFTYSPSIGLKFKSGLDVGAKYDLYEGYYVPNIVSLKLGYRFSL